MEQRSILTNQVDMVTLKLTRTSTSPINKFTIAHEFDIDPSDVYSVTFLKDGAVFDVPVEVSSKLIGKSVISVPDVTVISELGVQVLPDLFNRREGGSGFNNRSGNRFNNNNNNNNNNRYGGDRNSGSNNRYGSNRGDKFGDKDVDKYFRNTRNSGNRYDNRQGGNKFNDQKKRPFEDMD